MVENAFSDLTNLANRLADASGDVIRPYFRQPIAIDIKADTSPVTVADREAEKAIRALLAETRPGDGIIGEEFGDEGTDSEFIWVIDPIDGTKSFVTGRPIFGTLIALMQNGAPILGVIDQPIAGERWIGVLGAGSTINGAPLRVRECPRLSDATVATTAPDLFDAAGTANWQRIADTAGHSLYGGDCYTYAQVASGLVDAVVEAGLKIYDFAALSPVIQEAGGIVTDWSGNPLSLNSDGTVVACGDARVHAEIISMLAG